MKIINLSINKIKPYENNPRINNQAVEPLQKSIKEFGFKNPIIVDKDFVIINGHTRYKAALGLGLEEVPVIVVENLNEEQVKAYRIADNKVSEYSAWDENKLKEEIDAIEDIDIDVMGFTEVDVDNLAVDTDVFDNLDDVEDFLVDNYDKPEGEHKMKNAVKKQVCQCPHCKELAPKKDYKIPVEKIEKINYTEDDLVIRTTIEEDVDFIAKIASKNDKDVGFVRKVTIKEALRKNIVLTALVDGVVVGFCNFNINNKTAICKIYEICVAEDFRSRGIAKKMIELLPKPIELKCVVDSKANTFYEKVGFSFVGEEKGRIRPLNIWRLE